MIMLITSLVLKDELKKIGVHDKSIKIFQNRSEILPLKLFNVRTPAANILKQEMLSSGADCAIHSLCITGKNDYTDVLLLGTRKHYHELVRKLKPMTFFGLPNISAELNSYLNREKPVTVLADGRVLSYDRMSVMGIINITDDSFYKESRKSSVADALATAESMLLNGAEILDIGAESTRPGSLPVSEKDEQERLIPVIYAIKNKFPKSIISVDTYRASTAKESLLNGADIINDISSCSDENMIDVIIENKAPIIIMHMQGTPENMQDNPVYDDVVKDVATFLYEKANYLIEKGVTQDKIIIDPGIGFGKTTDHNLELLKRLKELQCINLPILLAASRKATIGKVLGDIETSERLEGTIALSCQAVFSGVNMVRVHDVKENCRAIRMLEAVRK